MGKKTKSTRYFGMTRLQIVIILFLGTLSISLVATLVFILSRWNSSIQIQSQPQTSTPSTILAHINLSTEQMTNNNVLVTGNTNLPDGTILMVSIDGLTLDYSAQDRVIVSSGKFRAGPFSSGGIGLNGGKYIAKALMPYPAVQPESVRKIIGNNGERLAGNQVVFDNGVLVVATINFEIIVPTPSPLSLPTSTPTPIKVMLSGGDIGKGWFDDDHRISLLSVYRIESLDGTKPFGEWNGGYEGGFTQFLVVELQFERFSPGYDEYNLSHFMLYSYTDDNFIAYQADLYLFQLPRMVSVYNQEKVRKSIAFEVTPEAQNFILCYGFGVAQDESGKIVGECGSLGYQFKFGD